MGYSQNPRHRNMIVPLLILLSIVPVIPGTAYAQEEVTVPVGVPCWEEEGVGVDIYERCGWGEDWLAAIALPFDWITGGYFSLIVVCVLCIMSYQKYGKAVYPAVIGIMYLPIAYAILPPQFFTMALLLAGGLLGFLLYKTFVTQTRDY